MANRANISNARANYTVGGVLAAPAGTALPTSATAAMSNLFKDWGFINEDGISKEIERNTEKIKDMNGNTVFVITSEHTLTFKFKPMELTVAGLKATLGEDNVQVDSAGEIVGYTINADELEEYSYIMNLIRKDGKLMRVVIPCGSIASTGEEAMKVSDIMGEEIELEALPDDSGNKAYVYFANPTTTGCQFTNYAIHTAGMDFAGDIDQVNNTIAVVVPNGTTLTSLIANFAVSSGATVKVGQTTQVSGVTTNSFASPQTYTVTNGSKTKSYTVTVTAADADE